MALRAPIYAYNRHLSFDVAFICSTLTHCGVCDLSVWRLKWEVSYVHQRVWRWKWISCQSSYVLQRLRLCRASDTVFRREIDSQRQWGYGTCYGDCFPAVKECSSSSSRSAGWERLFFKMNLLFYAKVAGWINLTCFQVINILKISEHYHLWIMWIKGYCQTLGYLFRIPKYNVKGWCLSDCQF